MVSESIGVPLDDKKLNNSFYNGWNNIK
jgi:hypothetical protein